MHPASCRGAATGAEVPARASDAAGLARKLLRERTVLLAKVDEKQTVIDGLLARVTDLKTQTEVVPGTKDGVTLCPTWHRHALAQSYTRGVQVPCV
eukprot:m.276065 g.276065  ORF g.276065 m.276065 type:complete len:96 (+) comp19362_c0_seq2:312-599(+)